MALHWGRREEPGYGLWTSDFKTALLRVNEGLAPRGSRKGNRQDQGVAQLYGVDPRSKGRGCSDLRQLELAGAQKFRVTGSPSGESHLVPRHVGLCGQGSGLLPVAVSWGSGAGGDWS